MKITRLNTFKFILITTQFIAGLYLLKINIEIIRSPSTDFDKNHPLLTSFLTQERKSSNDAPEKIISNDKKRVNPTNKIDNKVPSKKLLSKNEPNNTYHPHQRHHPTLGHRVPSYMIIGAMKGGTTTLTKLLERHPDIFWFRTVKELHFFDSHAHNPKKGNITASLEHFYDHLPRIEVRDGFSDKLIGDSTPRYIIMSDIIPTVKRLCP